MGKELIYNEPWIVQRADPYVYKHTDGNYYFTASIPAYDGICLRRAYDLSELPDAEEVEVWHKHESGPMSIHIWAPELHYLDGIWYIYYAGGDKDDIWNIRPYILECKDQDPMTGTWKELGMVQVAEGDTYSFQAFSLDATVFENHGKRYMVWAEKVSVGQQISNLYIAQMETPYQLKTQQVLLTTPDYNWERVEFWVNEGPSIIKRNGHIYLTYSASATGSCYCIGMLDINENMDLLDPKNWKKERLPVLQTDVFKKIYGPGHNSFTKDQEGNDIMVYHARKTDEISGNPLYDPGRHAHLMQIRWDKFDRPLFSYE
ncbi:MAG: family 43 glycosylhydrolase [Lachnotalea sp.]